MTEFFLLAPEVPGDLGDDTEMDTTVHPPVVTRFHLQFSGWSGDDLVESFPCYAVTGQMAGRISASTLTGYELRDMHVTVDQQAEELEGFPLLPLFRWLVVTGKAGIDDLGTTEVAELVVSEVALSILRRGQLTHSDITPYPGA